MVAIFRLENVQHKQQFFRILQFVLIAEKLFRDLYGAIIALQLI
jgi:hypothetical protein